jgi:Fe-S cluster assembly protein SufD
LSDKLKDYNAFVKEAMENYQKLPQETSEIYKRYFINIPFDVIPDKNATVNLNIEKELQKFQIKFDVIVLSDGSAIVNQKEFVKLINNEKLDTEKSMHKSSEDKYVAFINAYSKESILIDIPDNQKTGINVLVFGSDKSLNERIFIKLGKSSKLEVFEYYASDATKPSTIGIIHEAHLEEHAELELNCLHNENKNTLSLSFFKNTSKSESNLILNSVYIGSIHTRVRNIVEANEKNSKAEVNEVIFGASSQKFDIGTYVVNGGSHTNVSLESKAALMDNSFCIMKGFAKIKKGASKSKSYVHERGILLSKDAKVYGLPDMSVDENDVRATHSSATSPVDEESVFYLMSKGIDEVGVRKLLITGFFANSIAKIKNSLMKEFSMSLINSKLEDKSYGVVPNMNARNVWVASTDAKDSDIFKGHYKYRGTDQ